MTTKPRPKCQFCYTKEVPPRRKTCGDSACMSRHLYEAKLRKALSDRFGEVLTTSEMQDKYTVLGFGGGLCVVERKSDGKRGSLDFTHMPRFYHSFQEA